jgi:hypothetical protein
MSTLIFFKTLVFSLLSNLGLPIAITSALMYISLGAIAFGILIIAPELIVIAAVVILIAQLFLK